MITVSIFIELFLQSIIRENPFKWSESMEGLLICENCSQRQEMSKLHVEFLTDISNTNSCLLSDP